MGIEIAGPLPSSLKCGIYGRVGVAWMDVGITIYKVGVIEAVGIVLDAGRFDATGFGDDCTAVPVGPDAVGAFRRQAQPQHGGDI